MATIGIDFGTTKTLVAVWDRERQSPRTVRLGRGHDELPTSIHLDSQHAMLFGDDAEDLRETEPEGYVQRLKRRISSQDGAVVIHGTVFQLTALCGRYLDYVRGRTEETDVYGKVDEAVITVPALYSEAARQRITKAGEAAGFSRVSLLDEPLAAGMAFLHQKAGGDLGNRVLVFDWGGGTLDLALLEKRNGAFSIHPELVGGDPASGGEDMDDILAEAVCEAMEHEGVGVLTKQSASVQFHAAKAIRNAKIMLSLKTATTLRFSTDEKVVAVELTRESFESMIRSTSQGAVDHLLRLLDRCRGAGLFPDQVLLVGGASRIPLVGQMIMEQTGIKPIAWDRSMEAVALGAAVVLAAKEAQPKTAVPPKNAGTHTAGAAGGIGAGDAGGPPPYSTIQNTCHACRRAVQPHAKHCPSCGAELIQTCPECGADSPAGSPFCQACGTAFEMFKAVQTALDELKRAYEAKKMPEVIKTLKHLRSLSLVPKGENGRTLKTDVDVAVSEMDTRLGHHRARGIRFCPKCDYYGLFRLTWTGGAGKWLIIGAVSVGGLLALIGATESMGNAGPAVLGGALVGGALGLTAWAGRRNNHRTCPKCGTVVGDHAD